VLKRNTNMSSGATGNKIPETGKLKDEKKTGLQTYSSKKPGISPVCRKKTAEIREEKGGRIRAVSGKIVNQL